MHSVLDTMVEDEVRCSNCGLIALKIMKQTKDDAALYGTRTCTCSICGFTWSQEFRDGRWIVKEG